ncbi:hypothetical protein Salat_0857900 [Sesamum alatum]|uniref:Uncharacterized protein n=1 Tax=Sesamum alatum TaxID=300844 RepID=A0AAE1YIZ3_9LAMI|nr:hypothetical protein Salat_0857900 [Sesamum alatum]
MEGSWSRRLSQGPLSKIPGEEIKLALANSWVVRVGDGQSLILKPSVLKTKESASMVESVGGMRGGGLPCGGCHRSIYDLSFMDVDKIHPFSSTLGWHSLIGQGSNEERLTVDTKAPRDEEGRSNRRMLRGAENKHRFGDSRAKQLESCTLDGESPVAESITSLRSDPSSMGYVWKEQKPLTACLLKNKPATHRQWLGCKNTSVGERSALEEALARAAVDEAEARMVPPQVSSIERESGPKIRPKGVVDGQQGKKGRENASSQCSSTRRNSAECRKVKEVGDLMTGEPMTEPPVNGGHNYNGPKIAKFLVG